MLKTTRMIKITPWLIVLLLSGCANYYVGREQPEIHLVSIKPLPQEGLEQRFLIELNIINADSNTLKIAGLSYDLLLNERKVASGVSGKMTPIPGFSESRIRLEASTSLLSGLRLVTDLLQDPNPTVDYQFVTKLRTSWSPIATEIVEQGTIELGKW